MTTKQFRLMQIFALRMVPVAIGGGRWRKVLRSHVGEVLSRLACVNFSIHYSTIKSWDQHMAVPGDDGTCGFAWAHHPRLLCDLVSEYCFDERLERDHEDRHGNVTQVDTAVGAALSCCPVPCKGRQRIWTLPPDVEAKVRAQL